MSCQGNKSTHEICRVRAIKVVLLDDPQNHRYISQYKKFIHCQIMNSEFGCRTEQAGFAVHYPCLIARVKDPKYSSRGSGYPSSVIYSQVPFHSY